MYRIFCEKTGRYLTIHSYIPYGHAEITWLHNDADNKLIFKTKKKKVVTNLIKYGAYIDGQSGYYISNVVNLQDLKIVDKKEMAII